ncbi:hypothetical protein F5Y14DRAFT_169767 [Nemania sp. NC0429]|nr:hypothetical protein F5Y14DRAFT_169767 [Nemania sp. NC0429]
MLTAAVPVLMCAWLLSSSSLRLLTIGSPAAGNFWMALFVPTLLFVTVALLHVRRDESGRNQGLARYQDYSLGMNSPARSWMNVWKASLGSRQKQGHVCEVEVDLNLKCVVYYPPTTCLI